MLTTAATLIRGDVGLGACVTGLQAIATAQHWRALEKADVVQLSKEGVQSLVAKLDKVQLDEETVAA